MGKDPDPLRGFSRPRLQAHHHQLLYVRVILLEVQQALEVCQGELVKLISGFSVSWILLLYSIGGSAKIHVF